MKQVANGVIKERLVAFILATAGTCAAVSVLRHTDVTVISVAEYALVLLFAGTIILLDRYPIHLLRGTKISLVNLPIFLSAVLLHAPLVIVATGLGLLIANLLSRVERGLLPRDMISTIGQWLSTALLGYQIMHLDFPGLPWHVSKLGLLLICSFTFLSMDFLVFSLSQSFIYGEPFIAMLKSVLEHGFALEAIQYSIGILGALAAYEDMWSMILLIVPISITYLAFKNVKETRRETIQILEDLADTVDLRDRYTGGHSKGVANLVHQVLIQLEISGPEATLIETAARLHDIGKIGTPDSILKKPTKLSQEEMAVMRSHPKKGAELIAKYKDFSRGASMIMHHHERWDGRGYPDGLRGYEIPFGARVIAVADSFDAMTSDRPYRKAISTEQAIQVLLAGAGAQWDPDIVNAFVGMIAKKKEQKPVEHTSLQRLSTTLARDIPISS